MEAMGKKRDGEKSAKHTKGRWIRGLLLAVVEEAGTERWPLRWVFGPRGREHL